MTQPKRPPPIFTTDPDDILPRDPGKNRLRRIAVYRAGLREALAVSTLIFGLVAAMYLADLLAGGRVASLFRADPDTYCPHGVDRTHSSVIDGTIWTITYCKEGTE